VVMNAAGQRHFAPGERVEAVLPPEALIILRD